MYDIAGGASFVGDVSWLAACGAGALVVEILHEVVVAVPEGVSLAMEYLPECAEVAGEDADDNEEKDGLNNLMIF